MTYWLSCAWCSLPSPPSKEGGGQIEIVAANALEPWVSWCFWMLEIPQSRKLYPILGHVVSTKITACSVWSSSLGFKGGAKGGQIEIAAANALEPWVSWCFWMLEIPQSRKLYPILGHVVSTKITACSVWSSPLGFKGELKGARPRSRRLMRLNRGFRGVFGCWKYHNHANFIRYSGMW